MSEEEEEGVPKWSNSACSIFKYIRIIKNRFWDHAEIDDFGTSLGGAGLGPGLGPCRPGARAAMPRAWPVPARGPCGPGPNLARRLRPWSQNSVFLDGHKIVDLNILDIFHNRPWRKSTTLGSQFFSTSKTHAVVEQLVLCWVQTKASLPERP